MWNQDPRVLIMCCCALGYMGSVCATACCCACSGVVEHPIASVDGGLSVPRSARGMHVAFRDSCLSLPKAGRIMNVRAHQIPVQPL